MSPLRRSRRRGQVLIMVTLALIAMFGILGLAVDLGWAHFRQKAAQSAADAASLAAAHEALRLTGPTYFTCGLGGVECSPTPIPCDTVPAGSNLELACQYAQENGFAHGGRVNVSVAADITSPPPTAPGVQVYYWVTVRVHESIPQLFSAIMGNYTGNAAARATAAVADTILEGSLILLNRINDPSPEPGENLVGGGGPDVTAEGPILLASTADGDGGDYAGDFGGNGRVWAPRTEIRGSYAIGGLQIPTFPTAAGSVTRSKARGSRRRRIRILSTR